MEAENLSKIPTSRLSAPPDQSEHLQVQASTSTEELEAYPATTKWNDVSNSPGRYSRGAKSASSRSNRTDPSPVIHSSRFPTDQERQWYSAAVRSLNTRVICWFVRGYDICARLEGRAEALPTAEDACFVCKIDLVMQPDQRTSYPFGTWGQAAAQGCRTCHQIYHGVRLFASTYGLEVNDFHIATLAVRYDTEDISGGCQKILVGIFWVSAAGDMSEHLRFERYESRTTTGKLPSRCQLGATVQDVFRAAQRLVRTCESNHECLPFEPPDFAPTRLLEIEGSPCESVKLVETSDLPIGKAATRYIALSYCWGGSNPLLLRQSTSQAMHKRIDWHTLPKLFQHVVQLCQILDVRYVWIDALCIVQDDKHDWARESLLMGRIYRHAYLVVGATSCHNSSQALVGKSLRGVPIPVEGGPPGFDTVLCSTVGGNVTRPLHSRGWAFQEMILANRFLDFDANSLQLHCRQGTFRIDDVTDYLSREESSDVSPRAADTNYAQGSSSTDFRSPWSFRYFWSQLLNQDPETIGLDNSDIVVDAGGKEISVPEAWQEVVMMYSNRWLSYSSDILPALSGIASEYLNRAAGKCAGEGYFAGLWRRSFVQNLTWRANHEAVLPGSYHAPSWSWASLRGSVDYNYTVRTKGYDSMRRLGEQRTRLVDAFCERKQPNNPFGEVKSGFAILEGPVFTFGLRGNGSQWEIQPPRKTSRYWRPKFQSDVAIQVVQYVDDHGETRLGAQRASRGAGTSGADADQSFCEVTALHLFDLSYSDNGLYLVLGTVSLNKDGEYYERLGLLEADSCDFYGSVDNTVDFAAAVVKQLKVI